MSVSSMLVRDARLACKIETPSTVDGLDARAKGVVTADQKLRRLDLW